MQSAFDAHCTQWSCRQYFVDVLPQSAFATHCTHAERLVSQTGVGAEHCELVVHPTRQRNASGSQTGAAAPQFAFDRHWTHWPRETRQNGDAVGQSESFAHCTHDCVTESQIGTGCAQSLDDLQPTHAPVVVSHVFPRSGRHCTLLVHAGWHW